MTKVSQQDPNVNAFTDPNQNPFTSGGGSFGDKNKTGGAAGVGSTAAEEGESEEYSILRNLTGSTPGDLVSGNVSGAVDGNVSGLVESMGGVDLDAMAEKREAGKEEREKYKIDYATPDPETGELPSLSQLDDNMISPEEGLMISPLEANEEALLNPDDELFAIYEEDFEADLMAYGTETSDSGSASLDGALESFGFSSGSEGNTGGSSGSSSNSGSSTA